MLRWLHAGGRGYSFASSPELSIAANAYADDLGTFSSCATHLAIQAQKIDQFSEWAGLRPNVSKCAVTGILHAYAAADGTDNPLSESMMTMLKNRLSAVTLNGEHPKFLHPDRDPYRYLGVQLTMTLYWNHQVRAATEVLQEKGKLVNSSMLAPQQKLTFIQNCIRPAITYALPICPYTTKDVQDLDNKMAAIAKKAMGLTKCMPNGMALLSKDHAGLGVTSLFADYGQLVSAHLTKSFNDDGPLGRSTRALHAWQHRACRGYKSLILESNAHSRALDACMGSFSLMRQLSLIDALGVRVEGPSAHGPLATSSLYDSLAQYHKFTHPEVKKLPKCMAKISMFLSIGIGNMSELMEKKDGMLCMITATTLRSRCPQAERMHVHLLHQTTAYLCRGQDIVTKRLRDLPQGLRQISNTAVCGQ